MVHKVENYLSILTVTEDFGNVDLRSSLRPLE